MHSGATRDAWVAAGERTRLRLAAGPEWSVFNRMLGAGPWLTLLHGFPTSSWDWADVAPLMQDEYRLLAFDFLGFGESDKPAAHRYTIHEQADLTEALWRHHGVTATALLVHDYGVSVAQELLARAADGRLAVTLRHVVFLNGGLYPDLHRPRPVQKLLRHRLLGPLASRLMTEARFGRSFAEVFSPEHQPTAEALAQHWQALSSRGGARLGHRLIRYIDDRLEHRDRWQAALEGSTVPLRFVWGLADPVSGAPVAQRLRARLPQAPLRELPGIGHYPQLEVPSVVAAEVAAAPR